MTTPGSRPRKGWLSNLSAAMAPVAPEDDGTPIVRPRMVTVASVLTILGGLIFLFVGGLSIVSADSQMQQVTTSYNDLVKRCNSEVGGIGSAVPSPTPATPVAPVPTTGASTLAPAATPSLTGLASTCVQVTSQSISSDQLASIKKQLQILSLIIAAIGIAAIVGGWYLRGGAKWARRLLIGAAGVSLLLALLLQVSTTFTLLATLLIVVAILLTYIGRGGLYFLRLSARRAKH